MTTRLMDDPRLRARMIAWPAVGHEQGSAPTARWHRVMTAGNARRTLEASMSETASSMMAVEIATAQGREAFLLVIHVVPTSPRESDRDD